MSGCPQVLLGEGRRWRLLDEEAELSGSGAAIKGGGEDDDFAGRGGEGEGEAAIVINRGEGSADGDGPKDILAHGELAGIVIGEGLEGDGIARGEDGAAEGICGEMGGGEDVDAVNTLAEEDGKEGDIAGVGGGGDEVDIAGLIVGDAELAGGRIYGDAGAILVDDRLCMENDGSVDVGGGMEEGDLGELGEIEGLAALEDGLAGGEANGRGVDNLDTFAELALGTVGELDGEDELSGAALEGVEGAIGGDLKIALIAGGAIDSEALAGGDGGLMGEDAHIVGGIDGAGGADAHDELVLIIDNLACEGGAGPLEGVGGLGVGSGSLGSGQILAEGEIRSGRVFHGEGVAGVEGTRLGRGERFCGDLIGRGQNGRRIREGGKAKGEGEQQQKERRPDAA